MQQRVHRAAALFRHSLCLDALQLFLTRAGRSVEKESHTSWASWDNLSLGVALALVESQEASQVGRSNQASDPQSSELAAVAWLTGAELELMLMLKLWSVPGGNTHTAPSGADCASARCKRLRCIQLKLKLKFKLKLQKEPLLRFAMGSPEPWRGFPQSKSWAWRERQAPPPILPSPLPRRCTGTPRRRSLGPSASSDAAKVFYMQRTH